MACWMPLTAGVGGVCYAAERGKRRGIGSGREKGQFRLASMRNRIVCSPSRRTSSNLPLLFSRLPVVPRPMLRTSPSDVFALPLPPQASLRAPAPPVRTSSSARTSRRTP